MSSAYPTSLDSLSTTHADLVNEVIHAATINDLADAVNKIEAAVGVSPANDYATLSARVAAHANAVAKAHGFVAWTVDPILANFAGTQTNVHLVGVYLGKGTVINTLAVPVSVAGATMTHAQLGIYSSALALLSSTADSPTAFQTTGWVAVNLSAAYTVPSSGLYYLASAYAGTTPPTILNVQQNSNTSITYPGSTFPRGVHAQAQGTLPATAVSQGSFTNVPCIVAY